MSQPADPERAARDTGGLDLAAARPRIESLVQAAFGPEATIGTVTDAGQHRGVFGHVVRVALVDRPDRSIPATVVVKLPTTDRANRAAAAASGAYRREALAYQRLLRADDRSGSVGSPVCFHVELNQEADGSGTTASFVLEDLGRHRAVDQRVGLGPIDAGVVVDELGRLHGWWRDRLDQLDDVRRHTPTHLDPAGLEAGLAAVVDRWSRHLDPAVVDGFRQLIAARAGLVDRFGAEPATLCHGDPRADNLVFTADDRVVLFDWQQVAVQLGEADVAWLLATSVDPPVRRRIEEQLVTRYAASMTADVGPTLDRVRLGLLLPGLAVLLLAQRNAEGVPAVERFIVTSLDRIGTALVDHRVGRI